MKVTNKTSQFYFYLNLVSYTVLLGLGLGILITGFLSFSIFQKVSPSDFISLCVWGSSIIGYVLKVVLDVFLENVVIENFKYNVLNKYLTYGFLIPIVLILLPIFNKEWYTMPLLILILVLFFYKKKFINKPISMLIYIPYEFLRNEFLKLTQLDNKDKLIKKISEGVPLLIRNVLKDSDSTRYDPTQMVVNVTNKGQDIKIKVITISLFRINPGEPIKEFIYAEYALKKIDVLKDIELLDFIKKNKFDNNSEVQYFPLINLNYDLDGMEKTDNSQVWPNVSNEIIKNKVNQISNFKGESYVLDFDKISNNLAMPKLVGDICIDKYTLKDNNFNFKKSSVWSKGRILTGITVEQKLLEHISKNNFTHILIMKIGNNPWKSPEHGLFYNGMVIGFFNDDISILP